jgi:hypothetical protein
MKTSPEAIRTQILALVREYHAAKFGKMRAGALFSEAKLGAVPVFSADAGLRPMQNAKNKDLTPKLHDQTRTH